MTGISLIWTLFWHRFVPRDRTDGMKLLWVFLEPAAQIGIILVVFAFIGRNGGYGHSFALFVLTGVATLTIVNRGATFIASSVMSLRSSRRLAQVGVFTDALAALAFHVLTAAVYTAVLAWLISVLEHRPVMPVNLPMVIVAVLAAAALGFGLGLVRGHAMRFAPPLNRFLAILSRTYLFISGIFYMPSFLPPFVRDWLAWNPILHAVELMRRGFYGPDYPSVMLDTGFLAGCALGLTAIGVLIVWNDRRRVME